MAAAGLYLAVCVVRAFAVEGYSVPSGSMEPTLLPGDRIAVVREGISDQPLERGQLVVFDGRGSLDPAGDPRPGWQQAASNVGQFLGLTGSPTVYVKRVIGLPSDHVTCCADDGRIVRNGEPLEETYLAPGVEPSAQAFDVVVPEGTMWVLGDNRADSLDSRSLLGAPGGGMVAQDRIIGTPTIRFWPLDRLGSIDDAQPTTAP